MLNGHEGAKVEKKKRKSPTREARRSGSAWWYVKDSSDRGRSLSTRRAMLATQPHGYAPLVSEDVFAISVHFVSSVLELSKLHAN